MMAPRREQGKTVLVVDDEPRIIEALSMNLELEGYQASGASNGYEALKKLTEEQMVKPFNKDDLFQPRNNHIKHRCRKCQKEITNPISARHNLCGKCFSGFFEDVWKKQYEKK